VSRKAARRKWPRVSQLWIIWYAVLLHTAWGCLLLLSPAPYGATALHVYHNLPTNLMAAVFFLASALAAWAVTRRQPSLRTLAALLPQQALLTLSAYSAAVAVLTARYADGVPRPRLFILADQAPAILILVLHTVAVIDMHARRPNSELLRVTLEVMGAEEERLRRTISAGGGAPPEPRPGGPEGADETPSRSRGNGQRHQASPVPGVTHGPARSPPIGLGAPFASVVRTWREWGVAPLPAAQRSPSSRAEGAGELLSVARRPRSRNMPGGHRLRPGASVLRPPVPEGTRQRTSCPGWGSSGMAARCAGMVPSRPAW
jgi:hypothetical protein